MNFRGTSFLAVSGSALLVLAAFLSISLPICAQEGGGGDSGILIGTSLPLTGSFSAVGRATKEGMEAAFKAVNDRGGIGGHRVSLVACSDSYDPLQCVENTLQLINANKVFALCSYVGTPTSLKAQPVWQGAKIPVVGFYTGAKALREPFNRYNIHVRASYEEETRAAVSLFTRQFGAKKFALLYQDDSFGAAVRTATGEALFAKGLSPVASGAFTRGTLDVEEGLDAIVPTRPDVVVLAGTYAPLAKAIRLAKARGLSKTVFYTVSFVGPEALAGELGGDVDRVVVSEVVPSYDDARQPIVSAYRAALKGLGAERPSYPSFEGYLNARVLVEGLKRCGKEPTPDKLVDAIETIREGDLEPGFPLAYGPKDHQGLSAVYFLSLDGGGWRQIADLSAPAMVSVR